MFRILFFLLFVFFFFFTHIIKRAFEHTYLWQIKEYRWDRFRVFLRESGLSLGTVIPSVIAAVLSFFGILLCEFLRVKWLYLVIVVGFGYYVHLTLVTFTSILDGKLIRPKISIRNMLIVGTVALLSLIPMIVPIKYFHLHFNLPEREGKEIESAEVIEIFPKETEEGIFIIPLETATAVLYFKCLFIFDLALPVSIGAMVAFTSIFVHFSRKRKIRLAKEKIKKIENLKIIGITGSYGKTTTKEILHMILASKYKTYATPENVNSDVGVAITILENVGVLADVFIVEMGAYKIGEIKAICDIVQPDVAVITAIAEQHLALFGTIENTLKAKYEIVEHSKPEAVIVLNGDSDLVLRVAGKSDKREVLYSTRKELDVWASDIKSRSDRVEFNVHYKGKVQRVEIRMLGEHNISNVLAAVSVALQLDMELSEVAKALKKGSETKQIGRLSVRKSKYGFRVIDDSYNSNPAGFAASLDLLDKQKANKKVLVTIGILELGGIRKSIYEELSKKIVSTCDAVVTTDEKLVRAVKEQRKKIQIIFDKGIDKQLAFLRNEVGKSDVVLFEGPNLRLIEEIVK
ncbi:UDP-N-acetylmuramoyl-tripeptide--D-alanyl-D-alanine ligase [Candidatus Dojkabacteria bacterium]|nr:UDP-N-acetylmuramoyl-tripeptide--D-alanyl-D-alanine ligase [Candidatus Dojkabacteria bacterium]